MSRSWLVAVALLVASPFAFAAEPVAAPAETGEYKTLFNGKDLTGWDGDPKLWSVKDGAIRGETTPENKAPGNTFLVWKDGTVKNFELRLSYRCSNTNNSGIQYRSKHISNNEKNKWIVRGYQHELRNENTLPNVAGFIYDEGGKRGRICLVGEKATWEGDKKVVAGSLINADEYKKLFKLDDWNDVVIIGKGNNLQHFMNGRLTLDFTDSPENLLTEGVLALQIHGGNPMWTEFKNIRLKSLD